MRLREFRVGLNGVSIAFDSAIYLREVFKGDAILIMQSGIVWHDINGLS